MKQSRDHQPYRLRRSLVRMSMPRPMEPKRVIPWSVADLHCQVQIGSTQSVSMREIAHRE